MHNIQTMKKIQAETLLSVLVRDQDTRIAGLSFDFCIPKPQCISDYAHRRQCHGGRGDHRLDRPGKQPTALRRAAACLLAPDGRLVYAGRAGTGMAVRQLARLTAAAKPLGTDRMPVDVPPPRTSRFGSPLVLSRVHWVRPELVAEVTYLTWTDDGLLRHVVYQGLRDDKPASQVRRDLPDAR
jgi:hypothetical protein